MTPKSTIHSVSEVPHSGESLELMDISPIACRIGVRSQIVMTTRAWSRGYAPDPTQHTLPQQIAMRTSAPQLRDMIQSMLAALAGEDRTPCQFAFLTQSAYLPAGPTRSLAVAVNRGRSLDDYLVLDPSEQWFADFVLEHGTFTGRCELCSDTPEDHRLERDLNQLVRMAEKSFH